MTAIRQMLGGGPVMARNTAREAVQRSMKNRWWLFTSEAGSSVRAFPGQTWDDLAAVRHLDLRNPLQQLRANTFWEPLSLLGSREAAAGMRELDQVHPLIRASEDVMPHLTRLNAQVVGAGGSIAGSSVLTYIETDRLLSDVAGPAERLQLERSASWTSTSQ